MAEPSTAKAPIAIKKYANRRLYNTASSSYVTLDHLCQMVKDGVVFTVQDAKTGDDITRSVLTQIIVEEEAKGQNLLPIGFLRQLISFYGDSLQVLLPRYLDQSMELFSGNQEQMRKYMQEAMGGMFPFGRFEEMGRQNVAFFERAMKMFNPFHAPESPAAEDGAEPAGARRPEKPVDSEVLDALKAQLDSLQHQIERLTRRASEEPK